MSQSGTDNAVEALTLEEVKEIALTLEGNLSEEDSRIVLSCIRNVERELKKGEQKDKEFIRFTLQNASEILNCK